MKTKNLWRITFDTNPDSCNLNCIMCEQHSEFVKKNSTIRIMPFETIEKVVKETVPLGLKEIIPSTMGEPLLYKDFEKIIDLCKSYRVKLNLTTNGSFPKYDAKKWAEIIVPVACDVKISWNGATKDTYESIMKGNIWEKSLQNIKDFIAVRDKYFAGGGNYCSTTLQLTFMQKNVSELADMVKLAIDLGFDRVKGHHLWVNSEEMKDENLRQSPDSIKIWNVAVKKALKIAKTYKLPNGKSIKLENIFELSENTEKEIAQNSVCPFLGQEAWISAEGIFSPCCAPDELRKSLGSFGNINETSFSDIWESEQYAKLIENYDNYPLCKTCNMRRVV